MIRTIVSFWSCFCWLYRPSSSLAAKNIINLILVMTIWWFPCVESTLLLLVECVYYDPVCSLGKTLLALALLSEKAMAPHSSTLAWKIPWMEEPGGLQSMGSRRVRHDWATLLSLFTFMHWRRKWQPTPVFLPGESQGWGSLVGCRLWGCTELDTTEAT